MLDIFWGLNIQEDILKYVKRQFIQVLKNLGLHLKR